MNNTTQLLHRQLDAYSDSWRFESGREIRPWELEGWLEAGVSLLRLIRRLDEQVGDGREVSELYAQWLRNVSGPMGRLDEMEARGCRVADADDFRAAEREARGALHLPLEAVLGIARPAGSGQAELPPIDQGMGQSFPA